MPSKHPFEPFIPKGATKLIVGTIPPYRFCKGNSEKLREDDVNFYYGSSDNSFWCLLSRITKQSLFDIESQKKFLMEHKIGITDIVEYCFHRGGKSDDGSLEDCKYKELNKLLDQHGEIGTLIYTSKFVKTCVNHSGQADKSYHSKCSKTMPKCGTISFNNKQYKYIVLYSPSPSALRGMGPDGARRRIEQYKSVFTMDENEIDWDMICKSSVS